jgi:hypothetical protein
MTSYFPARKSTQSEPASCRQFNLTLEELDWDPSSTTCQEQEDATVDVHGVVHNTGDESNRRFISSFKVPRDQVCECDFRNSQCSAQPNPHDNRLSRTLVRNVKVAAAATGKRRGNMTAEGLAKHWSMSLDSAKQTAVKVTAQ